MLTQINRLKGRHVHMNFIRVGSDQFTDNDLAEMDLALQFTRDNYAQVNWGWPHSALRHLDGRGVVAARISTTMTKPRSSPT